MTSPSSRPSGPIGSSGSAGPNGTLENWSSGASSALHNGVSDARDERRIRGLPLSSDPGPGKNGTAAPMTAAGLLDGARLVSNSAARTAATSEQTSEASSSL